MQTASDNQPIDSTDARAVHACGQRADAKVALPGRRTRHPVRFVLFNVIGLDGMIAFAMLIAAMLMCRAQGLRFSWMIRDSWALAYHVFITSAFLPICWADVMIHLYRYARTHPLRQDVSISQLRDLFRGTFISLPDFAWLLRCTLVFLTLTAAVSHIKPMIPLFNPRLHDHNLRAFDVFLFGGVDIYAWFSAYRPPWLIALMNFGYTSLFYMICITASVLFVQRRRYGLRLFIASLTLAHLAGEAMHYALPSMGDIFLVKELYKNIPASYLAKGCMRGMELHRHILMEAPHKWRATPWQGIAAFPSLHVAQCALFLYFARRYHRWLLVAYVPVCLLLTVSTVWLGIHYILDLVVGYPLGVCSIWVARRLLAVNEALFRRGRLRRPATPCKAAAPPPPGQTDATEGARETAGPPRPSESDCIAHAGGDGAHAEHKQEAGPSSPSRNGKTP